jgi:hypothetical protein
LLIRCSVKNRSASCRSPNEAPLIVLAGCGKMQQNEEKGFLQGLKKRTFSAAC